MRNDEGKREPEQANEPAGSESDYSEQEIAVEGGGKYPEWDRLQDDVARQIQANRRFLERCLEDEFPEDVDDEDEEGESEDDAPVG